jgi:apolipoprotein N-acyltransferase
MSKGRRVALPVLTGVLLGAAFPPVPVGVTAFIGFLPLLLCIRHLQRFRDVFKCSYLAFLVMNLITVYWISGWNGDDSWLKAAGIAVNLVHPILFTLPMMAFLAIRKVSNEKWAVISFPLVWTVYEWLAQLPELTFPWLVLANTQTYSPSLIHFISFTGAFGVSAWIVAINAVVFLMYDRLVGSAGRVFSGRTASYAAVLAMLLLLPGLLSRLFSPAVAQTGTLKVGIIQPNIDPYEKWGVGDTPLSKLQTLVVLYDSVVALHSPGLVLFPETAIPFRVLMPEYAPEWAWFKKHIDSAGVPVLTGFPDLKWYLGEPAPRGAKKVRGTDYRFDDFNSAMLIEPGIASPGKYHKSRLTPMSERIPYVEYLPFLEDALNWGVGISSWGLGRDTSQFHGQTGTCRNVDFWTMICYETLFPSFAAGFVDRGSQFLTIITNDGWFGNTSGPYQLKQYAVLRSLENRRAIARCANNGISCFISPDGCVSQETPLYNRTVICGTVPLSTDKTFYTRHGDWLPVLFLALIVPFYVLLVINQKYRKKDAR